MPQNECVHPSLYEGIPVLGCVCPGSSRCVYVCAYPTTRRSSQSVYVHVYIVSNQMHMHLEMSTCEHACLWCTGPTSGVCVLVAGEGGGIHTYTHSHTHFLGARMSGPLIFCLLEILFEVLFMSLS